MSGCDGLLDGEPMRAGRRRVRDRLPEQVRGCARGLAVAGVVAGVLLLVPARAAAAAPGDTPARPAAPAAAAPITPPRISPYALAARRHAQETSGTAHAAAVPPSMRRTRKPIGQQVR